jgi:hypothetical protein
MPKYLKRKYVIDPQLFQRTLTWSLLAFIAVSLLARLLQQRADVILGVSFLASLAIFVAIVVWQHLQIRRLVRRLEMLEQRAGGKESRGPLRTITPSTVSHFDTEQLFHRGQTKH